MKATISPMPTAIMRDTAVSFRVTPVASRKGTKYSPRICHMSVKFEPPVKPLDTVYRRELRLLSAAPVRTHLTPLNLFPRPSDLLAQNAAAEPLGADLVIRAVGDHLFQRRVHSVHELRVFQVDGNTHFIHIKRVSHRFYCKAIFIDGREAHYLVRNDGIHSTRHQILEGNDIAVIPCDLVLIGQRYGDILECGSLHHPYLLAFQIRLGGDIRIVFSHEDLCTRTVVRTGEVHLLQPLVCDSHPADDGIILPGFQSLDDSFPRIGRWSGGDAHLLRDGLADVHVETDQFTTIFVVERLVQTGHCETQLRPLRCRLLCGSSLSHCGSRRVLSGFSRSRGILAGASGESGCCKN